MSTNKSGSPGGNMHTLDHARGAGHLFILSAPSGAGKTTLRLALLKQITDLQYSVSYTTRQSRQGEQNGSDYYFITKDEFEKGIAEDRWAEWAIVHGSYYGTSAVFLDNCPRRPVHRHRPHRSCPRTLASVRRPKLWMLCLILLCDPVWSRHRSRPERRSSLCFF